MDDQIPSTIDGHEFANALLRSMGEGKTSASVAREQIAFWRLNGQYELVAHFEARLPRT